jgi:hypothetical protein
MHRFTILTLALAVLGASLASVAYASGSAKPIQPEQLGKLLAVIKPGPEEDKWAAIPWQTDLWRARQLAAEQGKPILLWEMDGHPLGCT